MKKNFERSLCIFGYTCSPEDLPDRIRVLNFIPGNVFCEKDSAVSGFLCELFFRILPDPGCNDTESQKDSRMQWFSPIFTCLFVCVCLLVFIGFHRRLFSPPDLSSCPTGENMCLCLDSTSEPGGERRLEGATGALPDSRDHGLAAAVGTPPLNLFDNLNRKTKLTSEL